MIYFLLGIWSTVIGFWIPFGGVAGLAMALRIKHRQKHGETAFDAFACSLAGLFFWFVLVLPGMVLIFGVSAFRALVRLTSLDFSIAAMLVLGAMAEYVCMTFTWRPLPRRS